MFSLSELLLRSICLCSDIMKHALNASHRKQDWMAVLHPYPSSPKPSLTLLEIFPSWERPQTLNAEYRQGLGFRGQDVVRV